MTDVPSVAWSCHVPEVLLYFTNALSSFCNPIPVNCAQTIDLKPVALLPSDNIPHIPNTERREQLNTYGEADVTLSLSTITIGASPVSDGVAVDGGATGTVYVNEVVLRTCATT